MRTISTSGIFFAFYKDTRKAHGGEAVCRENLLIGLFGLLAELAQTLFLADVKDQQAGEEHGQG